MASLPLPTAFPTTVARRRRRPEDGWARWGVRLALSAPLVALGVWAGLRGFVSTGHAAFLTQAGQVAGGARTSRGCGSPTRRCRRCSPVCCPAAGSR